MKKAMPMSLLFVMMAFMVTDASDPEFAWRTPAEHTITKDRRNDCRVGFISSVSDPKVKRTFFPNRLIKDAAGQVWVTHKPSEKDTDITLYPVGDVGARDKYKYIPKDGKFLITLPPFNTETDKYKPSAGGMYDIKWENGALVTYDYPYTGAHKEFKDGTALSDGSKIKKIKYFPKTDSGKVWYTNSEGKEVKEEFNKAFMERQMGITRALKPGNDKCTVTWGEGKTMEFAPKKEFKLASTGKENVILSLSKTPPKIRYISKNNFVKGETQVEVQNAGFDKAFLQQTETFKESAAHREYRDVLSDFFAAQRDYHDLLADFQYDEAVEAARQDRAVERLKGERKEVLRAKQRMKPF